MKWQKRVRVGVAIFGIAFAIVVYAAIGERQAAAPPERPVRFDSRATIESTGASFQQFRETKQDYVIEAERQMTYADDSVKFVGITIKVKQRAGRDFVVTGAEATAGANHRELEITGTVKMSASDGLVITTERATFSEADGTIRVPGPVSFAKGGMAGTGVGMTYDQNSDVLVLSEQAHVTVTDGAGNVVTDFTSGSATLDRLQNFLELRNQVHVTRKEEVIDADNGVARLTANEEFITFIELRGNARVVGGAAFDSMSGRDIDLDYTDDGEILERVVLTGSAAIATKGSNGGAGRQYAADSLDIVFAPDATITRATGRTDVRLDLPAAAEAPARSVTSQSLDATGQAGKGLTEARFAGTVEYREALGRGAAGRVARAQTLRLELAGDAVASAVFKGGTSFEEPGLRASGAQADYDPGRGSLHLSGRDAGGGPHVEDENITVDAGDIDLALEGRRMTAQMAVRTTMRGRQASNSRLPGLLEQTQPVTVIGDTLDYQGASGKATYAGAARLIQGSTSIGARTIVLDQNNGNLTASGDARSSLTLDTETSNGRAAEIRYEDAKRTIIYDSPRPAAGATMQAPYSLSQLSGPQGDLRAERLEVVLAEKGATVERLEGFNSVDVRLDMRTATSSRLTYFAADQRYELTGVPAVPVTVKEACRETTGRTVTLFKATDRIIVDGREETLTQSRRGAGACSAAVR